MKHHPLAYVLFFAVAACSANDEPPSASQLPIVGGAAVTSGYDNVVLVEGTDFLCTGTLIGPRTVLTAAHCVSTLTSVTGLRVRFGNSLASITMSVNVEEFRFDRRFGGTSFNFDAAVLKLASPVNSVTPVVLNVADISDVPVGDRIKAVGFGITTSNGTDSGTKRQVDLPIIAIGSETLSIGDTASNICRGDSGGPEFRMIGGVEKQIAISSFTTTDRCGSVAGAMRVDRVLDFVSVFKDAWEGPCQIDGACVTTCPGHPDPDCDPCGPEGTCASNCPEIDYDCPPGKPDAELCDDRTQCENRRCYQAPDDPAVKYCAAPCDFNGACPIGSSCILMEGGLMGCAINAPTPFSQGQPCDANDDCYSNVCERRICMTPCDPDNDTCPEGSSCQSASQVPHACAPGDGGGCAIATRGGPGAALLILIALVGLARRSPRRRR